jgi:DNA-binding response OmpR family regulator
MRTHRILVASSNLERRRELRTALECEGHQIAEEQDASAIISRIASGACTVLVVDSALEGADVLTLCRTLRAKSNIGIIILSRDDRGQTRIDALNAGADDFLAPGFVLPELLARVRAILRRLAPPTDGHQLILSDRSINFRSYEIQGPGGRIVHLTPKECLVLRHLVSHANRPLTPQNLARNVWQRDGSGRIEYVRVVVKQLRRKLEPDPDHPRYILTHRSTGYQFQMPA